MTKKQQTKNNDSIESKMDLAYYPVLQDHYLSSNKEIDKQILYLSTLAIGLLMTLGSSIEEGEIFSSYIWLFSNILFISTIIIILFIFGGDADHISMRLEEIESGASPKLKIETNKIAKKQERREFFSRGCFILAIILALTFSILSSDAFITNINFLKIFNI